MTGRLILVTGANTGIGFEAAKYLCDGGNEVILACRNEEKGKAAAEKILKDNPNALVSSMLLDLADMGSIHKFAQEFHDSGRKLNVLINNAGVYLSQKNTQRQFTKDNFELTMGTNYLGHFLLTHLLLDDLKKTGSESHDTRIINVTSILHDRHFRKRDLPLLDMEDFFLAEQGKYNALLAYKNSKLANIIFTYDLAKRLEGTGVTVNCICPGFIPSSSLIRHADAPTRLFCRYILGGLLRFTKVTRTLPQAAQCVSELATDEKLKGVTGKFYRDHVEAASAEESHDEELQKKLWEISARYCHLGGYEPLDAPPPPLPETQGETKAKVEVGDGQGQGETEEKGKGETEEKGQGEGVSKAEIAAPEGQTQEKVQTEEKPRDSVETSTPSKVEEKKDEAIKEVKEETDKEVKEVKEDKTEDTKAEEKKEEKTEEKKEEKTEEKKKATEEKKEEEKAPAQVELNLEETGSKSEEQDKGDKAEEAPKEVSPVAEKGTETTTEEMKEKPAEVTA